MFVGEEKGSRLRGEASDSFPFPRRGSPFALGKARVAFPDGSRPAPLGLVAELGGHAVGAEEEHLGRWVVGQVNPARSPPLMPVKPWPVALVAHRQIELSDALREGWTVCPDDCNRRGLLDLLTRYEP
jgi:hypothetical protein